MRALIPTILVILFLPIPTADAAPQEVDFVLTFDADGTWSYDGPLGMLTPRSEETGTHYAWDLLNPDGPAYGEVRYTRDTFDLERAEQFRPSLDRGPDRFPLFHYFPRAAVWETDGPAQVYHLHSEGDTEVLRLQIPATTDGRFMLERDVTPPNVTLDEVEHITHYSFHQQTRTDEMAIVDMQVRPTGSDGDWVRNPTPEFHVLQKFRNQGLDPDSRYDVRVIATDWSNNTATAPLYTIQTRPLDHGAPPSFEIVSPEPDAVLPRGADTTVRLRILDGDTAVDPTTVRLFFDQQERPGAFTFEDGLLQYDPPAPLSDGLHVVSVEARTLDGAEEHVRWVYHVGSVAAEAPAPAAPLLLVLTLLLGLLGRHER